MESYRSMVSLINTLSAGYDCTSPVVPTGAAVKSGDMRVLRPSRTTAGHNQFRIFMHFCGINSAFFYIFAESISAFSCIFVTIVLPRCPDGGVNRDNMRALRPSGTTGGYDAGFHFPQERRKVCDYYRTTLVRIARVIASPVSMISASL